MFQKFLDWLRPRLVQYMHHGVLVWTRTDLRGAHRENCLCYMCAKFHPGSCDNCPIAQKLYRLDCEHNLTTPVFECAVFEAK